MQRRKLFEAGKKRIKSSALLKFSGPNRDNGLVEPLDNIPSEKELREKMSNFLVKLNEVDVKKLEFSTRDQHHNQDWYIERKKRLTASNFGDICKMRVNTIIKYDHDFWITKMEEKLNIFYLECLLPEIVCPLYGKRLELTDIREPEHIQEAIIIINPS
ncbi:uncharacterized protein LOC126908925 [Daktulosphaira vitifoliae]|uniref:uncharacterized protein LOC126908925 n=1 Tax=Daktulosphaira vitifoliae TaxID=58002 RepID=UPI0021AAF334|nr:uncharacterized protein LOC126908925 [Daktulosphaira vitifoliae]